jgi:hypothetical protein
MSTHVNFAIIQPRDYGSSGRAYSVAIVRGREASGNSGAVEFDWIAENLDFEKADMVARAAPHIGRLDFYQYAKAIT